jgi:signal transduction histidine kinase
LTALLCLLVLVPAGALAWLGFRSAGAAEAAEATRIRREVDDAEDAARRALEEAGPDTEAVLRRALESAAAEVRARLPYRPLDEVVAAAEASLRGALGLEVRPALRLADARRWTIHPAEYPPTEATAGPLDEWLAGIGAEADRLLIAGDRSGAEALWTRSRERLAPDLRHLADLERAHLRVRASRTQGAATEALAALAREGLPDMDGPPPRVLVLLRLLAAQDGDDPSVEWLTRLARSAAVDRVPLAPEERARLAGFLHGETVPGAVSLGEVPVAGGVTLAATIPGRAVRGQAEAAVVAAVGPAVEVRFDPSVEAPGRREQSGIELERRVRLEGPLGSPLFLTLRHLDAESALGERSGRRFWTSLGVASLVGVVVVGLYLARRALAREQAARRLTDEFVANVSRELRTPLTSVLVHAELLAEGDPPPERRRALAGVLRAEGERLAALVDDLLDFARLARGARRIEPEPVDLGVAARRSSDPYLVLAEREGVGLALELPPSGPAALADPHALGRILSNLLANAWTHGRPSRRGGPGRIRVRAYDGEAGPTLEVRDDGPGIPPEEREAVFERFRRGRGSEGRSGVGLGLALSRELARVMGGDLTAGAEGDETVLRLRLPRAPEVEA